MIAAEKSVGDFGGRLREARERRGLSLRVIADATRISVRALDALERNDIRQLPGGIFSRAFVRAYALEVGLDPEQTIAEFITRFPDETVTQGHPRTRAAIDERDARPDGRQRLRWALLALALLIAALVAYLVFSPRTAALDAAPAASALVR
jgi:cytoskeletal protein RodZ